MPFRKPSELERLRAASGIDAEAPLSGSRLDLTDETAVLDYFESVAEDRGGVDVLVNAAGGFAEQSPRTRRPGPFRSSS